VGLLTCGLGSLFQRNNRWARTVRQAEVLSSIVGCGSGRAASNGMQISCPWLNPSATRLALESLISSATSCPRTSTRRFSFGWLDRQHLLCDL
jgi:hypothetical protein